MHKSGDTMLYQYEAACISRTGLVRDENEDNFLFHGKTLACKNQGLKTALYADGTTKEPQIFAIFDGMGGEVGGDIAASIGAETLKTQTERLRENVMQPRVFLEDAVKKMNCSIFGKSKELGVKRIGTTVALAYVYLDQIYICNVGDSRIYRFGDRRFDLLSEDDTVFNPDFKNQHLTQFLGLDEQQYSLRPHIKKGTVTGKDIFLLCSDGLYNALTETEIAEILKNCQGDLPTCAKYLADAAEEHGGEDNCTIILLRFMKKTWLSKLMGQF